MEKHKRLKVKYGNKEHTQSKTGKKEDEMDSTGYQIIANDMWKIPMDYRLDIRKEFGAKSKNYNFNKLPDG